MAPRTPSRSTRYSAKPRDTADREERRAFAQRKKRKLDTIKATSSRSNMTADKRERVTKKALATAKSGTTYTTYSKKPRTGGAGADTISSKRDSALSTAYRRTVPILLSGPGYPRGPFRRTGQMVVSGVTGAAGASEKANKSVKQAAIAKKKAAGAKAAAKKQNYR